MASEVGICNLALSHLGDSATVASINPPEGSAQAEHCQQFYPLARDTLLEMHAWRFATRRASLPLLDVPAWEWQYAYAAPNGLLRVLSVISGDASSETETEPYEVETADSGATIILTNLELASVRYIAATTDTSKFSPLFTDTLAKLLASYLAGPVLKGDAGISAARAWYQVFLRQFAMAAASDASQRSGDPRSDEKRTAWIAGR